MVHGVQGLHMLPSYHQTSQKERERERLPAGQEASAARQRRKQKNLAACAENSHNVGCKICKDTVQALKNEQQPPPPLQTPDPAFPVALSTGTPLPCKKGCVEEGGGNREKGGKWNRIRYTHPYAAHRRWKSGERRLRLRLQTRRKVTAGADLNCW